MHWLAAAASFERLLVVLLYFSFFFGMYNGAMVAAVTEVMPREVSAARSVRWRPKGGAFRTDVIEPRAPPWVCCSITVGIAAMTPQQPLVFLARSGYAARGVIYLIMGIFALLAARDSSRPKDSHSSLVALLSHPLGYLLIGLVIAGLLAFAAWRVLQATRDVDHHGTRLKGLVIRAGLLSGALVNGALGLFALGLLTTSLHPSGHSNGQQTHDLLAQLLSWKYSNALVYLVALVPLGVGIAHLIKGWKASFEKYFAADEDVMRYVRPISRFGLIARGVVFLEIALLLAISGSRYEAIDPPGMKEALDALQALPSGGVLLMIMALGLIAFAVYSFAEAAWRRINMDVPGVR
jgi:hypothetical protein